MRSFISAFIFIALCAPLNAQEQNGLANPQEAKLPIPDKDAQKESLRLVGEIFKSEHDAARTPEQKVALARTFIKNGLETKDDATSRYVLLRLARDIASKAGDSQVAFDAISHLEDTYRIDALKMKAAALGDVIKSRSTPNDQKEEAVELAIELIDCAVSVDDYTTAKKLGTLALSARLPRDSTLRTSVVSQIKKVDLIQAEFEKVKQALVVLETTPTDPQANLVVGTFRCFMKADWQHGLPMLALGDDPVLKSLARKELEEPNSSSEQVALGDGWWKTAETQNKTLSDNVRDRAVYWYQKALPQLSGLGKTKVAKRLEGLQVRESVRGRKEEWISKDATYRVSSTFNGKTPLPSLLNESQQFHYRDQYAFVTNVEQGAWVTIDLRRPKRITRVFILNRTIFRDRAIGMSLYISIDGKRQNKVWSATQGLSEWNVQLKSPIQGRYITLKLPGNVKQHLSLKQVQVFGY